MFFHVQSLLLLCLGWASTGRSWESQEGSYNSFTHQVGYCKNQGFDTMSRASSNGPRMFVEGRIMVGVGLSNVQFQDSIVSCGRCLNMTSIENFWALDRSLTTWDYDTPLSGNFVAFVMDRCDDPICTSGFLDFDIYNPARQPTKFGNPRRLQWDFVPCPVGPDDFLELLLCLGPHTCQEGYPKDRPLGFALQAARDSAYFSLYVRNARVPVVQVEMEVVEGEGGLVALRDDAAWQWAHPEHARSLEKNHWTLVLTSIEGVRQATTLAWNEMKLSGPTSAGYRGGIVVTTDIQV